jgi:hypothetical protein
MSREIGDPVLVANVLNGLPSSGLSARPTGTEGRWAAFKGA